MEINKGLHKQGLDNTKPSGSWVQALNVEYTKDLKSITNCRGNIKLNFELPDGYTCVGTIETPNEVVVFLQGTETIYYALTDIFAIGRLKENSFDVVFKVPNHKINHEILGTYKFNYKDELTIIWCNGNYADSDNLRIVNLDTLPFEVDANKFIIFDSSSLNRFSLTQIAPEIKYPILLKQNIINGSLKNGTYQFFVSYEKEGLETNYFFLTNKIILANIEQTFVNSVFSVDIEEDSPSVATQGKSDIISVIGANSKRGLDLEIIADTKFQFVNLFCIYTNESNVDSYHNINRYNIIDGKVNINLVNDFTLNTGSNDSLIDTVLMQKANALTAFNNRLYIGNYSVNKEEDLRSFSAGIGLKLIQKSTERFESYKDNLYNYCFQNSFQCGEVYAFYIHYIDKQGNATKGFHIPWNAQTVGFDAVWNANEIYEDNTYGGGNVRHHFIPYPADDNYQQLFGFEVLENTIPTYIKNNYTGYFISYAKRTIQNSRIIGTGALFQTQFRGIKYDGSLVFLPEIYDDANGFISSNTKGHRVFNEMGIILKNPEINPTKIRSIYKISNERLTNLITPTAITPIEYIVDDLKYLPDNNYATLPLNKYREKRLYLRLKNMNNQYIGSGELEETISLRDNIRSYLRANFFCYDIVMLINDNIGDFYFKYNEQKELVKCTDIKLFSQDFNPISYNGDVVFSMQSFVKTFHKSMRMVVRFWASNIYNGFLKKYDSTDKMTTGLNVVIANSRSPINTFTYNDGFNKKSTIKVKESFNKGIFDDDITSFRLNIARSRVQQTESLKETWNKFDALEYRTLNQKRQEIISLKSDNRLIYAQTKDSLFIFQTKDELVTANDIVASLGNSDIFGSTPTEILYDDKGFIGCDSRFNCILTPSGYFVLDRIRNNIFHIQGGSPKLISNAILNLKDKWKTLQNEDNPCLTNKGNRFILDITNNNALLYLLNYNGTDSFNLSYNLNANQFISLHSFVPIVLSSTKKDFYSITGHDIYKFNDNSICKYYDEIKESYIDVVLSNDKIFKLQSLIWDSNFKKLISNVYVEQYDKTFTNIALYNNRNCTGLLDLANNRFKTNRGVKGLWYFNSIRNIVSNKNEMFINNDGEFIEANLNLKNFFDKSKFFSNFVVVRFYYNNIEQLKFFLNSINIEGQIK